jgi:DNA polymerase
MSDTPSNNPAPDLRRMLRQHVESLRAAGIEWLPKPTTTAASPAPATPPATAAGFLPPAPDLLFEQISQAPTLTLEQKRHELTVLNEKQVVGCTRCTDLARLRTQTVFGVGNPNTELVFVGEAPGADEDAQGEPFVGAAGQLLNKIIIACKMKREDVYICNVLKCRPPGNRTPLPDEVANCRGYLDRQLELIRPKFICALGACAAQALLETTQSIGKLRGRFHDYHGIQVWCTYHPAYLLRNPAAKRDVWEDMKKLMAAMGRPVA